MISAGRLASTHLAPCNTEAERPATTPRRCDHSQAARARDGGELGAATNINVAVDRHELRTQSVRRQGAGCDGLATDEWHPHARSVPGGTDSSPSVKPL